MEELKDYDFTIIAIALDEDVDAIRQWARDEPTTPLTYPVLVDRDFIFAETYGITNVPSTVWIDEAGNVVRPPAITPGDDTFKDFTQIDSMHLLRAGHQERAAVHLATAMELAPEDWTIHRGSMPVRGEDPFGQAFFDFYQAWETAGRPGYAP